jgi:hypothetical protein
MDEGVLASLIEFVRPLLSAHSETIALVLLVLLLVQSVRLLIARTQAARRVARHRQMGEGAERRAKKLLLRAGYRIVEEQVSGGYQMLVDGEPNRVRLRADFLVERQGRRHIAEVKSGFESAKVSGRGTRRQLLEYCLAFRVDGVLLVDMHRSRIQEIGFPSLEG